VGLAVLREIDEHGLQEHAREVGAHLLAGLRTLDSELVGDFPGRGLFLGVELMRGRTPASAAAEALVDRLRSRGVFLSTGRPDRNVIKIKPPLVFSREGAELVVQRMRDALAEFGGAERIGR
jgi:4-aminobutyrate aminotransferase-like enzyme